MIRIWVETIPHKEQRYATVGDYWTDKHGVERVTVSEMEDWRYELIVAVHEIIESFICKHKGIPEPVVMAHDLKSASNDPGFDSDAPYREQHHFASGIEMLLAKELGIDWSKYCEALDKLCAS